MPNHHGEDNETNNNIFYKPFNSNKIMATTSKKNVTKNTVKNETTKRTIPVTDGSETKVVCPVCGSEFAIGEHEHTVKNATVIGQDSGLGTVYLAVNKRGDALKAAGVDTSKYFAIQIPGGGEQWMQKSDDAKTAVPVSDPNILGILNNIEGDPIAEQIMSQGTVPNRSLFRRWVMSQTFHGLTHPSGYAKWLEYHGYDYQWEMLEEELRVQAKLYGKDMENFKARNRWFNQALALAMAHDYIEQVKQDAHGRKQHKCKGVPYVKFDHHDVFLTDIDKKLIAPLRQALYQIATAKTPQKLYEAVRNFWRVSWHTDWRYRQCREWKDAYKGMGAYATMQNLLRFHGCTFPKDNDFYKTRVAGLDLLERAAEAYKDGEGWRLFGLMKQMLSENGIDIKAKMKEWSEAKAKRLKR